VEVFVPSKIDISGWGASPATDMGDMFSNTGVFNINISGW
jgi:hypothetical protein